MKTPWKALNYRQIRRGIELCNDNVVRLLRNATLALAASQWPATVYNSVLAMEEQGRLLILYEAYIDGIAIDNEWWRIMFGDHRLKITALATAFFIHKKKKKWTRTLKKLGKEYQELKERSMYVNYNSITGHWVQPGSISKRKAKDVFKTVNKFVQVSRDLMSD